MVTNSDNCFRLEAVMARIQSEARTVQILSTSLPVGPVEKNALAKISERLESCCQSIDAIAQDVKKGGF